MHTSIPPDATVTITVDLGRLSSTNCFSTVDSETGISSTFIITSPRFKCIEMYAAPPVTTSWTTFPFRMIPNCAARKESERQQTPGHSRNSLMIAVFLHRLFCHLFQPAWQTHFLSMFSGSRGTVIYIGPRGLCSQLVLATWSTYPLTR
jgi:hypothetical protein